MGNSNFPASKLIKYWHEVTADSTAYHGKSISSHLIFLVKSFRIINETEAGKTNSCPLCTGRWAPPHPLFKASNTLGCFNRVSLAFNILGLLDLIYIYADLAEKMETRKWENIIQTEPGTFHVTKMKNTNTRQKDKHEGKRRYWKSSKLSAPRYANHKTDSDIPPPTRFLGSIQRMAPWPLLEPAMQMCYC